MHNFVTESPWEVESIEKRRLEIILSVLECREIEVIVDEIEVIVDEIGHKKKEKTTDYVARQYKREIRQVSTPFSCAYPDIQFAVTRKT